MKVIKNVSKAVTKRNSQQTICSDKRAVSVSVDHALGLFVLLIISGVFVSGVSSSFEEREKLVTEKELERITDEVASSLVETDSLVMHAKSKQREDQTDDIVVSSRVNTPTMLSQQGYTVTVGSDGENTVVTSSSDGIEVSQTVSLDNDVEGFGGSSVLVIEYDGDVLSLRGV